MSLADKKRSVFTTIGSYTSLMSQEKSVIKSDIFSSINNKNDTIPYLLDVTKVIAGGDGLNEVMGKMFSDVVVESEANLKVMMSKQFIQSNADEQLPPTFINNGINIPVKTIDVEGKFKTNPSSDSGNLIYGSSSNFNTKAYDAIANTAGSSIGNINMSYNQSTDELKFKASSSGTIGDFFNSYINNVELLDKKELISSVMNEFYGTITEKQGKTVEEIYNNLMLESLLGQVLDGDDSFVISPDKYDELLARANEIALGINNYDLGCGTMSSELSFDDFNNLISLISGSTDPYFIAEQLTNTIDRSTENNNDITNENKETIKDNFIQRIIKIFTIKMLGAITMAPQVRMLLGIMSSFQNGGNVLLGNPIDDMKHFKQFIKCMSKEIMRIICRAIFTVAIGYLVKLLKPVIKKVAKEKLNQYTGVMMSLTGALGRKIN